MDKKRKESLSAAIRQNAAGIMIGIGTAVLTVLYVIYLFWGENIEVTIHDQLDGEVLYYLLRSADISSFFKHSFSAFMAGNADVEVPAAGFLVFYRLLPPVTAYVTGLFFIRITAFISMFLLLNKLNIEKVISFLTALIYSFLPIYAVYGLSIMGVPLVLLAFINLCKGERKTAAFIEIMFYALNSSLTLAGFAVIIMLCGALFVWSVILHRKNRKLQLMGIAELIICYLLTNFRLIWNILIKNDFVSHRTEFVLKQEKFWDNFREMLFTGHYHSEACQKIIVYITLTAIVTALLADIIQHKKVSKKLMLNIACVLFLTAIAAFYAFYRSKTGAAFRELLFKSSSLKTFKMERMYWLDPVLWYLCLGLSLSCIRDVTKQIDKNGILSLLIIAVCLSLQGAAVVKQSDIWSNIKLHDPDRNYDKVTWSEFFCEDIFKKIDDCLGDEKENTGVVSVGLYPSIPLYFGYNCLDGYSNNYDLQYKTAFGSVIEKELEKNAPIHDYFTQWGNRCYIFSSELGKAYLIEKSKNIVIDLDIDTSALKLMGCGYILSAVKIDNAPELNLSLMQRFDSDNSYYEVYLYKLTA